MESDVCAITADAVRECVFDLLGIFMNFAVNSSNSSSAFVFPASECCDEEGEEECTGRGDMLCDQNEEEKKNMSSTNKLNVQMYEGEEGKGNAK